VLTKETRKRVLRQDQSYREPPHVHEWSDWKEIGRTGDWFHPIIVERKCKSCGVRETDEH
jgi:hypothetical protein